MGCATMQLRRDDAKEMMGLHAQCAARHAVWQRTAFSSLKGRGCANAGLCMIVCILKWEKGCEFLNCKYKHERPTKAHEKVPAAPAQSNAATTRALPTEITLQGLLALCEKGNLHDADNYKHDYCASEQVRFLDAARGR